MGCAVRKTEKPIVAKKINKNYTTQNTQSTHNVNIPNGGYKLYDPNCKEKQYNVMVYGVLFQVINPPEKNIYYEHSKMED